MATLDVIIPVYNEEETLAQNVLNLRQFLSQNLSQRWTIVIADNGSVDRTLSIAQSLSREYPGVSYIHLDQKGRGRALHKALLESNADILSYMDIDLSTDLNVFPQLVGAIEEGYDIAIGSRLMASSQVKRSPKREVVSRLYNLLIKLLFFTRFHDAQCGFKAISGKAARELVPLVKNKAWFFDTELLILAEKNGYRIKELPVTWVEDPGSTVNVLKTAAEDFRGLMRMRFHRLPVPDVRKGTKDG